MTYPNRTSEFNWIAVGNTHHTIAYTIVAGAPAAWRGEGGAGLS